ncbi:MAG TPA: DUF58 domain-containing protein [Dokdonella sp.]|uniref:DUF58 domain-containing protein n=1 Tax=Dokdonella sp. TaxID=2291710 RepID=UPI002D800991|nr:DUF58 domain-containing protein [Dokdonella sp.]HET9033828.1 DUF58 domain-containing protein [Dokdonella sp.]
MFELTDELRARLRDLRLSARSAAGGNGLGMHASRSRGAGLEFAQYRGYEPGDEPRRIDWKLYARSDRYFVREAERDSPLTIWIVIDASASMAQADQARADYSKLDAAKLLAACTIELALRQGDRFGLIGLSSQALRFVADAAGPRQRDRCLLELAALNSGGLLPDAKKLRPLWERILPGSLVLLLSDCFDDDLVELATRLAAARREVLSIQLISAEERDFPFRSGHRFRDPETGAELRIDARLAREGFIKRFEAARAELAKRFAAAGVLHVEHVLDRALDEPLQKLFGSSQTMVERR